MPQQNMRRSGKGPLALRRRLRRMPVGAHEDTSGNAGDVQMLEILMKNAGPSCSDQNLPISVSGIYRGRCRAKHPTFPILRLRLFLRSCSSMWTLWREDLTRRGHWRGGRAKKNLEGRCCDFTQINLKGGLYRGLRMRRRQRYERVRMP